MDFLSKLFSDAKKELNPLLEKLKEAAANLPQEEKPKPETKPAPAQTDTEAEAPRPQRMAYPDGRSWGEIMPEEENQFSFNGSYRLYFEQIFRSEFPQYRLEEQYIDGNRTVYTFWSGSRKALVVELMSQRCEAKKLRRTCGEQGIPYLRYYFDHEGWWNTRSYVVNRTKKALGL